MQNLTETPEGTEASLTAGWQIGADVRIGDALYVAPGMHFARSATVIATQVGTDSVSTEIEDNLIRSYLKLRALVGYKLINEDAFKLRVQAGPSYDLLLSVQDKDDKFEWDKDEDFNSGTWNIDAGVGVDISIITVEAGAQIGMSNVFKDDGSLKDYDSKYMTWYLTVGLVFGGGS
ncbi:MAG: outer membrane beta-barrel protein [Flavobacteriales bacterium]|nr:outer membrane beta-barrel protein [Flavobacteriales bacterium]MCB0808613.1 outer membrane beta-barrel protein [Flavobacteriales bacterium]